MQRLFTTQRRQRCISSSVALLKHRPVLLLNTARICSQRAFASEGDDNWNNNNGNKNNSFDNNNDNNSHSYDNNHGNHGLETFRLLNSNYAYNSNSTSSESELFNDFIESARCSAERALAVRRTVRLFRRRSHLVARHNPLVYTSIDYNSSHVDGAVRADFDRNSKNNVDIEKTLRSRTVFGARFFVPGLKNVETSSMIAANASNFGRDAEALERLVAACKEPALRLNNDSNAWQSLPVDLAAMGLPAHSPHALRLDDPVPLSWGFATFEDDSDNISTVVSNSNNGVQIDNLVTTETALESITGGTPGAGESAVTTLRQIVRRLERCWMGHVAFEFDHLTRDDEMRWCIDRVENSFRVDAPIPRSLSAHEQRVVFSDVARAHFFEDFLSRHYPATKRFGLEGLESLIPGLRALLEASSRHGVSDIVMAMTHRGRLNVLANLLEKPIDIMCRELNEESALKSDRWLPLRDVKYHLGTEAELAMGRLLPPHIDNRPGARCTVKMCSNPSHLEAIYPVAMGMTRALQDETSADASQSSALAVVIHGDASFSGQGVVAETLQLGSLPSYTTGGAVHIILNNQIGFTTDPRFARTAPHPTDVAKLAGAPILHVNADDPEAVVFACRFAAEFRAEFLKDVVIDIVGYRRHGHNELDDPSLTQPLLYRAIDAHPTCFEQYAQKLETSGIIDAASTGQMRAEVISACETSLYQATEMPTEPTEWLKVHWHQHTLIPGMRTALATGVNWKTLDALLKKVSRVDFDEDFVFHPSLQRLMEQRSVALDPEERNSGVDFATAETLAFASLLNEGIAVRLSGQDVERGTFNQRHAVVSCQKTGRRMVPLNSVCKDDAWFEPCNSPLAETSVLGFEYGHTLGADDRLVVWEAQFGDFANVAQPIIDLFLASGEARWMNSSRLVVCLPHGMDGNGPDHSSARIERFLQLADVSDVNEISGKLSPAMLLDCQASFEAADTDHNGWIDRAGLQTFLNALDNYPLPFETVESIWQEVDSDHDGQISFEEWVAFLRNHWREHPLSRQNMIVVNPSTPSQLFHALRRQVHRKQAKPLVMFTPKFLLHHRPCRDTFEAFDEGTSFISVKNHSPDAARGVRRLFVCSGQVAWHLQHAARRAKFTSNDIAIVTIDELAPFPACALQEIVGELAPREIVYVQEEPMNMGPYSYLRPRLDALKLLGERSQIRYVTRPSAASPATGSGAAHRKETDRLLSESFEGLAI